MIGKKGDSKQHVGKKPSASDLKTTSSVYLFGRENILEEDKPDLESNIEKMIEAEREIERASFNCDLLLAEIQSINQSIGRINDEVSKDAIRLNKFSDDAKELKEKIEANLKELSDGK